MKYIVIAYGWLMRWGFEWAMPVYALFNFSLITNIVIWSLFLLWQGPATVILVKLHNKELAKLEKAKA